MVEVHEKETINIRMGDGSVLTVAASDVVAAVKRAPTLKTLDFARLVSEMRHGQKEYFRTRSTSALEDSKRLEKKVDEACKAILDGQGTLFQG
jgi:hypothetical protein